MLAECKENDLIASIKKESQATANQLPALEMRLLKAILPSDAYDRVTHLSLATLICVRGMLFLSCEQVLEVLKHNYSQKKYLKCTVNIYSLCILPLLLTEEKYAHKQKWQFRAVSASSTECGGYREAVAEVTVVYIRSF